MTRRVKTIQVGNKLFILNGHDPLRCVDLTTNKVHVYKSLKPLAEAIPRIKQAFADENYVQIPTADKDKAGFIHIHPEGVYMTGTYWYERFCKEVIAKPLQTAQFNNKQLDYFLRAAKRAAGISND